MCKLHNALRHHMAAAISLDRHKFRRAKRKPCYSHQTYFSFPSPSPLHNAHAHAEKYGWLARLVTSLFRVWLVCGHVYLYQYVYRDRSKRSGRSGFGRTSFHVRFQDCACAHGNNQLLTYYASSITSAVLRE